MSSNDKDETPELPTQHEFAGDGSGRGRGPRTRNGTGDDSSRWGEARKLMERLRRHEGVVGSVIVGHDGLVIATDLSKEFDTDIMGALSLAIFSHTGLVSKKIGRSHLHQLVTQSDQGYTIIADFGGCILMCVTTIQDVDEIIPVMREVTQLVAQ